MKLSATVIFPAGVVGDRPVTQTLSAERTAFFRGYAAAIGTTDLATAVVVYSDRSMRAAGLLR